MGKKKNKKKSKKGHDSSGGFDADAHKGKGGGSFEPVPAGKYVVQLVKAERKAAKKAGNYYLNCQFVIVKGKHKKHVVFEILNLENSNETAQEIAESQLANMMLAVGAKTLKDKWDVTRLMNKDMSVMLKIEKDEQYGDKNRVASFVKSEGGKKGKKNKKYNPDDVPF